MQAVSVYVNDAADDFAVIHPRCQMIFKVLQQAGSCGLPFHRLLARTGLKPVTLAFHLGKMANGRIVRRRIKGPDTWLTLDYAPFALFQAPVKHAHLTKN